MNTNTIQNDLGKNVSAFLKAPELERVKKLKERGISLASILRRGIDTIEKEIVQGG